MLINFLNFNGYISTNMLKCIHVLNFSTVFYGDRGFKQMLVRNKPKNGRFIQMWRSFFRKASKNQASTHAPSYAFSEVLVITIRAELRCVGMIPPRHFSLFDF